MVKLQDINTGERSALKGACCVRGQAVSCQLGRFVNLETPNKSRCWQSSPPHEAAHVRYTDFYLDYEGSALRRRLTNLLEDVRIEKAIFHNLSNEHSESKILMRKVRTNQRIRQMIRKPILRHLNHRIRRIKQILCQVANRNLILEKEWVVILKISQVKKSRLFHVTEKLQTRLKPRNLL